MALQFLPLLFSLEQMQERTECKVPSRFSLFRPNLSITLHCSLDRDRQYFRAYFHSQKELQIQVQLRELSLSLEKRETCAFKLADTGRPPQVSGMQCCHLGGFRLCLESVFLKSCSDPNKVANVSCHHTYQPCTLQRVYCLCIQCTLKDTPDQIKKKIPTCTS